jgi:TolA-binding protein
MKSFLLFFALFTQFSIVQACLSKEARLRKPVSSHRKFDLQRSLQSKPESIKLWFAQRTAIKKIKQLRKKVKELNRETQKLNSPFNGLIPVRSTHAIDCQVQ